MTTTSTHAAEPPALRLALAYHARGWSVLPLHPRGKRPLVPWKTYQGRRPAESEVREWFERWPTANVGIVTGAVSGLVVIDADSADGERHFIERCGGHVPVTPTVRTGRGRHWWFAHPCGGVQVACGPLAPGLDVKADGGYVVAPPSLHPSGTRYRFEVSPAGAPLAPLPAWVKEERPRVHASGVRTGPTLPPLQDGARIPEGARNNTLFRHSRSMRLWGAGREEIRNQLHDLNLAQCDPPLPPEEVEMIARNAWTLPDRDEFAA